MISNILSVTLFLGVTCNTCEVYIYDSSNKYTIQRPYKPSVISCYFAPTSLSWNSVYSVMRLLTLIFKMLLLCLYCSMTLMLKFQVVFWTCLWSLPWFVFQSHKTFHVEDATLTQQFAWSSNDVQVKRTWIFAYRIKTRFAFRPRDQLQVDAMVWPVWIKVSLK